MTESVFPMKIEGIPGGGPGIFFGGTRTEIKLRRSWQQRLPVADSASCPFCTKWNAEEKTLYPGANGTWAVMKNQFTPYPIHDLIIPNSCWDNNRLYELGGAGSFGEVLMVASKIVDMVAGEVKRFLSLTVHIGPLAGQNIPHLHFHILEPPAPAKLAKPGSLGYGIEMNRGDVRKWLDEQGQRPELLIFEDSTCRVFAGGYRAGQCFFVPKETINIGQASRVQFANIVLKIIRLYAERFRSDPGGLPPEYKMSFKITELGSLVYGFYVPILNNWGATEDSGLLGEQPMTVPWPHEITAAHLRGEGI
ncbi:MAG: HIT domain-containing protein [Candidatus Paceibacterota bacterium]|jgi:diadenosine tetraphosphate (Ap4A) HIT family hydrolase